MAPNHSHADAGLVCTLRNAGKSLDSFIAWHLAAGFSRLFLFFDDPADPDMSRIAANPAITIIPHDEALRRAWLKLPEYQSFGPFAGSEVMARQVLNAALAMELARARGLAWLLHIDADELFFSPGPYSSGPSVPTHFHWADAQKANAIKYWNYEAVPETMAIDDAFRQVDLFKIPPVLKPGPTTKAGLDLLAATPQLQPGRFHFYSNGKAAVRLAAPGMRPRSVHDFDDPVSPTPGLQSGTHFILHYACCGFENFWEKYVTLGGFADKWFGKTDIRAATGSSLHLEARDVVASGERERAREFYRRRIAIEDTELCEALIRHGVLTRFDQPRRMLEAFAGGG
jgi:hypothetical protein